MTFPPQPFHLFGSGQTPSEITRVPRPGGYFLASCIIRGDSVPWVQRLAASLRHYDPTVMRGDYGHASLAVADDSKYFPEVEHCAFHIWQAVSLDDLQQLVVGQPLPRKPSGMQRKRLTDEIKTFFEQSVGSGGNLRLPFQLLAWRTWVNRDELTKSVSISESGIGADMQVAASLR